MAKNRSIYQCQSCGLNSPKWMGKCPDCGNWNSFIEEKVDSRPQTSVKGRAYLSLESGKAVSLFSESEDPISSGVRFSSGIGEVDRCFGMGVTKGSLTLIGGDPGIGKSTLTLQMLISLLARNEGAKALYVSGEESHHQVLQRAKRILSSTKAFESLMFTAENELEKIDELVEKNTPTFLVLDSIQTTFSSQIESSTGTVTQVKEVALRGLQWAKNRGVTVMLVGHVNKEGSIAGPKLLEHMVDTVLYLEGETATGLRLLRTVKNRFGPTSEIGIFEMTGSGLSEIPDPSQIYRTLRQSKSQINGTSLCAVVEGSRPLVTEVQALVGQQTYGLGRRVNLGIDSQRASIVCAVLEKYLKIHLNDRDVFTSTVGGLKMTDPAADLALAGALLSSFSGKPLAHNAALIGEVTLTGEVRHVPLMNMRLQELSRLGIETVIGGALSKANEKPKAIHYRPISHVRELRDIFDLSKVAPRAEESDEHPFI